MDRHVQSRVRTRVRYGTARRRPLWTVIHSTLVYFKFPYIFHPYYTATVYISLQGVLFYACVDLQLRIYTMYQYEAPEWYESDPRCLRVAHSEENHRVILVLIMGAQHAGVYECNCTVAIAVASNCTVR